MRVVSRFVIGACLAAGLGSIAWSESSDMFPLNPGVPVFKSEIYLNNGYWTRTPGTTRLFVRFQKPPPNGTDIDVVTDEGLEAALTKERTALALEVKTLREEIATLRTTLLQVGVKFDARFEKLNVDLPNDKAFVGALRTNLK